MNFLENILVERAFNSLSQINGPTNERDLVKAITSLQTIIADLDLVKRSIEGRMP